MFQKKKDEKGDHLPKKGGGPRGLKFVIGALVLVTLACAGQAAVTPVQVAPTTTSTFALIPPINATGAPTAKPTATDEKPTVAVGPLVRMILPLTKSELCGNSVGNGSWIYPYGARTFAGDEKSWNEIVGKINLAMVKVVSKWATQNNDCVLSVFGYVTKEAGEHSIDRKEFLIHSAYVGTAKLFTAGTIWRVYQPNCAGRVCGTTLWADEGYTQSLGDLLFDEHVNVEGISSAAAKVKSLKTGKIGYVLPYHLRPIEDIAILKPGQSIKIDTVEIVNAHSSQIYKANLNQWREVTSLLLPSKITLVDTPKFGLSTQGDKPTMIISMKISFEGTVGRDTIDPSRRTIIDWNNRFSVDVLRSLLEVTAGLKGPENPSPETMSAVIKKSESDARYILGDDLGGRVDYTTITLGWLIGVEE